MASDSDFPTAPWVGLCHSCNSGSVWARGWGQGVVSRGEDLPPIGYGSISTGPQTAKDGRQTEFNEAADRSSQEQGIHQLELGIARLG